jgi:hypothetical protein
VVFQQRFSQIYSGLEIDGGEVVCIAIPRVRSAKTAEVFEIVSPFSFGRYEAKKFGRVEFKLV